MLRQRLCETRPFGNCSIDDAVCFQTYSLATVVLCGVLQSCFSSSGRGSTNNCNILVALTAVYTESGVYSRHIGSRTIARACVQPACVCL